MKLLYFALLRERVGVPEESLSLPPDVKDVGTLLAWLREQSPNHAAALCDPNMVRVAVNQDYAALTDPVRAGDEVALFPPVTGG
ncbi:molybdopterin converting factor subunit 1 [Ferrovibrio sp.]|uniref:molybdopterin converting factor subunit 1 n=1 Tax=Ferrovibrio sp. TaxID=1917215 RepID=UPI0025C6B49A|nr:molybdopterin converting factor subunit 1 [Ferrovibrio sp.]MBX3455078.1 molybdopterin converting factor subunit 1 [Ferrovibrio sp.]